MRTYDSVCGDVGSGENSTQESLKPERDQLNIPIVGDVSSTDVIADGNTSVGLLDSGSQVTTVAEWYYQDYLKDNPLLSVEETLHITGATGDKLPYKGVVEVNLSFPEIADEFFVPTPVLIVGDTEFSRSTPFIIGMNVIDYCLNHLQQQKGINFLQKSIFPTSWSGKCAVRKNKKSLKKLGKVISTCQTVIPANSMVTIHGKTRAYTGTKVTVLSEEDVLYQLPSGITVMPSLQEIDLSNESCTRVGICLSNLSDHQITIPSKAVISNLQQVSVLNHTSSATIPSEDEFLSEIAIGDDITPHQQTIVKSFLKKWTHIFSHSDTDIGRTNIVKHKINLTDETPIKQRHYRIPPHMYEEVKRHIHDMLEAGVIRESCSPFASPVVLVRKPDNTLRFCIDYRKLNSVTVKDAHALPRINETLDSLIGAKYFTSLDLKSGYWQMELEECDKAKTAFTVGPLGFYEWETLPFGLVNAPATFQRLLQQVMSGLHLKECLIYLDDIIIFSTTFEEHLTRLENVFKRLDQANLKLKPSKCKLFQKEVKYLGHIVSDQGISTDPKKIETLQKWPRPTTVKEVRQFIGFASFYRRFIPGFARIARPLHDLLKGETRSKKKKGKQSYPSRKVSWTKQHQEAFESLISKLCAAPVLAYADFSKPFVLHTDASTNGLGAVLYQKQEGHERPIAYASRSLSTSERNYPAYKLEFLAMKWSITDKFRDYLFGAKFVVRTDNNPLKYVLTTAKLDATGQRWVSELADFNFTIEYRSGKSNVDADALSRVCFNSSQVSTYSLSEDVVHAICLSHVTPFLGVNSLYRVPSFGDIGSETICLTQMVTSSLKSMNTQMLRDEQLKDPALTSLIQFKEEHREIPADLQNNTWVKVLLQQVGNLLIHDGVLCRKRQIDGEQQLQLILPSHLRKQALHGIHDKMGHMGRDRTLYLAQERFFWPYMSRDIERYVSSCHRCLRKKAPINTRASLVNITTSQPLEILCMDFLKLDPCKGNIEDVLIITDHFTRYSQAIPLRNQSAKLTAKALFDNFINHYGFPMRLHSDQGRNFESKVINELCQLTGTKKSRTTPYHPMSNGQCERYNRTLINMLGCLEPPMKADWKMHIGTVTHAYNCTRNEATGYTPFYLMYGRHPRLPIDLILGLGQDVKSKNYDTFVKSLHDSLSKAYNIAQAHSSRLKARHKKRYDKKTSDQSLKFGDKVLVRNLGIKGRHKLADLWEETIYEIIDQPNLDIPVYKVKKEGTKSGTRTLHRNLLFPLSGLPIEFDHDVILSKPDNTNNTPLPDNVSTDKDTSQIQELSDYEEDQFDEDEYIIPDIPMIPVELNNENDDFIQTNEDTNNHDIPPLDHQNKATVEQNVEDMPTEDEANSTSKAPPQSPSLQENISSPVVPNEPILESTDRNQLETIPSDSVIPQNNSEVDIIRRSSRTRNPPERYGDFVFH